LAGSLGSPKSFPPCNAHGSKVKSVDFEPTDPDGFGVLPNVCGDAQR
jgi:hypothetical protein